MIKAETAYRVLWKDSYVGTVKRTISLILTT